MASVGAAARCIGLSGRISVIRDFFGYRTRGAGPLSLGRQMRLLRGKHVHLNLIRTAGFTVGEQQEIDVGLHTMRDIYATVNVGVGRIQRFLIPPGHEVIDDTSEAEDLWNEFNGPDGAIDVFLAQIINGDSAGKSPVGGSCDKDSKDDSGCVIAVADNSDGTGTTLGQAIAHEVGHFLGLEHETELPDNLMYTSVLNGGKLYGGQGGVMVLHCSMNGGCQT
jgi:hypothetical protein